MTVAAKAWPILASCFYPVDEDLLAGLFDTDLLDFSPPPERVFPDKDAAARVLAAYQAAQAEDGWETEGMWATIHSDHYQELVDALERSDVSLLSEHLEKLFAKPLSVGLSMGGEVDAMFSRPAMYHYAARWLDSLFSLGCYLGFVRGTADSGRVEGIETPDQVGELYEQIVETVGDIAFPEVCAAWGITIDGTLIPRPAWRWIYSAHRLTELTQPDARIVEVGGGFGAVAFYLNRRRPSKHVLYDLPLMNAIAGYFLIRANLDVSLLGEESATIEVLPTWRITDETHADLVFNQDSLPEMPETQAAEYLEVFDRIADVFYSENHEDGSLWYPAEIPQLRLPDLEHHLVRLRRRERSRAWMRRGHIETIYR